MTIAAGCRLVIALAIGSACSLSDADDVFYGSRSLDRGRGELISFSAEDPNSVRTLIAARDEQYFGPPCWVAAGDAFDVVRVERDVTSIERVTTEFVSVSTLASLGELQVVSRKLHRSPKGERLYLLGRIDDAVSIGFVDAEGAYTGIVGVDEIGDVTAEQCTLKVLGERRVSLTCESDAGTAPLVTVVDVDDGTFDTWSLGAGDEPGGVLWAPDGTKFAYCSGATHTRTTYLAEAGDIPSLAELESVELGVGCPQAWDATSRRLATNAAIFDTQELNAPPLVFETVEVSASSDGEPRLYVFSPDGQRLAHGKVSGYVFDLETGVSVHYDEHGGGTFEPTPVWEASGRWLYRGTCESTYDTGDWTCHGAAFDIDRCAAAEEPNHPETPADCGRTLPGTNGTGAQP